MQNELEAYCGQVDLTLHQMFGAVRALKGLLTELEAHSPDEARQIYFQLEEVYEALDDVDILGLKEQIAHAKRLVTRAQSDIMIDAKETV